MDMFLRKWIFRLKYLRVYELRGYDSEVCWDYAKQQLHRLPSIRLLLS
jgi:hypothetical protein